MKYRYRQLACVLFVACAMASTAGADIIVTRSSDPATAYEQIGGTFNTTWAASWTQNFASTDTSIRAFNLSNPSAGHSVNVGFDLGTTVGANDLGSALITIDPDGDLSDVLLFTGLTLGPGDYYLNAYVDAAATSAYAAIWHGGAGAGYAAPGAAFGYDYADLDSTLPAVGFQVDGTFSNVPEPSSLALLAVGTVVLVRRRRDPLTTASFHNSVA